MVVKIYISGISGNKEVKKRQQRVMMILDSKTIKYSVVDITEPGQESEKDFMQNNSTSKGATIGDVNPRHPLPPQIFNESEYCGDYDQFDNANEIDTLEQFLKLEPGEFTQTTVESSNINTKENHEDTKNGEIKMNENDIDNNEEISEQIQKISENSELSNDLQDNVDQEEQNNDSGKEISDDELKSD